MITPVQVSMIKSQAHSKPAGSGEGATPAEARETGSSESLVSSIGQDGGLKFLQAHLQDKLTDKFPRSEGVEGEGVPEAESRYGETGFLPSAEATASSIVNFALSLKDVYFRQNEGQSPEELMAGFESEIRQGIGDGFASARQYLQEIGHDGKDTQEAIDETWTLIQQKLVEYFGPQDDQD